MEQHTRQRVGTSLDTILGAGQHYAHEQKRLHIQQRQYVQILLSAEQQLPVYSQLSGTSPFTYRYAHSVGRHRDNTSPTKGINHCQTFLQIRASYH